MRNTGASKAEVWLQNLVRYLKSIGVLPSKFKVKLRYSDAEDEMNRYDARMFCSVRRGSKTISCAGPINDLPATSIVAILLHEIGHMHLDEFDGKNRKLTRMRGAVRSLDQVSSTQAKSITETAWPKI